MSLETLRSRYLYGSFDAALTAGLRPRRSVLARLRKVIRPGTSNYDRVGSMVNLLGAANNLKGLLFSPDSLPFAGTARPFRYGTGSSVFLLEEGNRRSVLKVYRRTLGASRERLLELARFYRGKYRTVSRWYAGCGELVWPAEFLILHGPVRRLPAVACCQPYLEGDKKSLLRDISKTEFQSEMRENPALEKQVRAVARRTLEIYSRTGSCIDLIGDGNLALVRNDRKSHLRLIDYGIFTADFLAGDLERAGRLERALKRLRGLVVD